MARRIHNVDLGVPVLDGGVLGQDGDARSRSRSLESMTRSTVSLVLPVDAALLEHFVHQGGLAVVNVGDKKKKHVFFVLQWVKPLF